MKQRELGNTARTVGAIGLGCMGMSWGYSEGQRDDATSVSLIHEALESGVTFLDTADVYGDGHNEQLVGQALQGRRDQVVLATKCGLVVDDLARREMHRDGSPEHVRGAVEASLRRLNTDVIDLYYLHRVDPDVPLNETWGAMAELVAEGKVRHLGLSEVDVEQAAAAHAQHPVTAIQSELSLWTRDALDGGVVDWCAENAVAFVPFAPLGRGFLTGAYTNPSQFEDSDFRSTNPRFAAQAWEHNRRIVEIVEGVAARHEATPAQIAIAWTLARGEHVIPIPGTKRVKYLRENIGAAEIELTGDDLAELDAVPASVGSRY